MTGIPTSPIEPVRCDAVVHQRDTLRYTGRGKSKFEMHYIRRRCKRKAAHGDLCRQHHDVALAWGDGYVSRWTRP